MIIHLRGVLEDGTGAGRPVLATPISFPIGSTVTIDLEVVTPAGVEVDLAGATLVLTLKQSLMMAAALAKEATLRPEDGRNRVRFSIVPIDTSLLPFGFYSYDVWLERDGARNCVVPLSAARLGPAVG